MEDEPASAYSQLMPDKLDFALEAQLMPVHLQFNFLLRTEVPLHNEKNSRHSEEMMPPPELVRGLFGDRRLDAPSHVVVNHANCWIHETAARRKREMSTVSVTSRLSKSKFLTLMYYKPDLDES